MFTMMKHNEKVSSVTGNYSCFTDIVTVIEVDMPWDESHCDEYGKSFAPWQEQDWKDCLQAVQETIPIGNHVMVVSGTLNLTCHRRSTIVQHQLQADYQLVQDFVAYKYGLLDFTSDIGLISLDATHRPTRTFVPSWELFTVAIKNPSTLQPRQRFVVLYRFLLFECRSAPEGLAHQLRHNLVPISSQKNASYKAPGAQVALNPTEKSQRLNGWLINTFTEMGMIEFD
jgi:hypothetical protein